MIKGYIDSIETMGLVDGPGVRFVVFFKGCKLRCLFCHNPETWTRANATEITSEELIKRIHKYHSYYQDGGVTFSGGQVEGSQGFQPQPEKDLERPSSTRLEARFPSHGSGAVTRSPSHSHGDPTSLAPHERLTDLAVVPREKPHTGAAAREQPRDSPVIER